MSQSDTNKGYPYKRAWEMLFSELSPELQAKVLEVKDSHRIPSKEVVAFFQRVIALAEQDDKKT